MKICSKCGEIKPDSDTSKGTWCRNCRLQYHKEWYLTHKEERHQKYLQNKDECLKYNRQYRKENIEKIKERGKLYYIKNKEKLNKQHMLYNRIYRKLHPEKVTIKEKLNKLIRQRVLYSLKHGVNRKNRLAILGYDTRKLKKHLEKKFKPGMTWDNHGKDWHIDHIIPVSAFNFSSEYDLDFKRCWTLSNLQPLWATENHKKKNKLEKPFQPSLAIRL